MTSYIGATPFSWILEGLSELTWRPSRALVLALYVAFGIMEMQGHGHVCQLSRSQAMSRTTV